MPRRLLVLTMSLSMVVGPVLAGTPGQAPTVFRKLDFYVQEGDEMEDYDAQLIIDAQRRLFIFAHEDRANEVFAAVPWDRITGVTYENSKHARITAGLLIAWPMLFLSGKKHWLTFTYGPGRDGSPGGYAFARMDKDNFQTILAAINGYTGYEIRRIEENGEISVLYPGIRGATEATRPPAGPVQPSAAAQPEAMPAGALPPKDDKIPAGALPPTRGDEIPAGPLPPAQPETVPLELLNKGAQWTERTSTAVGYSWAAEVGNDNAVALDTTVVLRLFDAQGAVLHEARRPLTVTAGNVAAFTAEGEVAEADAVRADHWEIVLETPQQVPAPAPAAYSSTPSAGAAPPAYALAPAGSTPAGLIDPVPLTEDVVEPVLIPESVQIVSDNPALQQIHFEQTRITIRCLVRADGTVADVRVLRITPQVTSPSTEDGLKEAIADSAIRFWRFQPAYKNATAVPVWFMVTVEYTSPRGSGDR